MLTRRGRVRRAAACVALGLAVAPAAPAAPAASREAPPRRILSLNLCTDQLVLALADRAQIAALTQNAENPLLSAEAKRAAGLRRLGGSAEAALGLAPDLVVAMRGQAGAALAALAARRPRLIELDYGESYGEIVANIRTVARAVGHPARGAALIARMDAALAQVGRPGQGRVAAYYQRRGYLTGTGTLVDDLMRRLGLVNLAARLGRPPLAQLSLEELIAARPDYLIVEQGTDRIDDQGTEMLHHPALAALPRLRVPAAWTVCGGPAYVLAARGLARQIAARPLR